MNSEKQGRQPVLVFADRDHSMGLMVDEIVDIVEAKLNVDLAAEQSGRIGSAIIAGQATEIVDAGYYLSQAFKDWFGSQQQDAVETGKRRRVLLVDDSAFFRNLLAPQLTAAGFQVIAMESADKALSLSEAGEEFEPDHQRHRDAGDERFRVLRIREEERPLAGDADHRAVVPCQPERYRARPPGRL